MGVSMTGALCCFGSDTGFGVGVDTGFGVGVGVGAVGFTGVSRGGLVGCVCGAAVPVTAFQKLSHTRILVNLQK